MPGSRILGAVVLATGTAVGGFGVFTMTARADTTISARPDGKGGWTLADQNGATVYGYVQDPYDRSKCNDDCTNSWKPVPAPLTGAGEGVDQSKLSTIKREDGSMQAAYDRRPLYTYTGDQQSGDRKGQGAADQWYVIGADGQLNKSLAAASAASLGQAASGSGDQQSPSATDGNGDGNGQGQDGQNGDGTAGSQDGNGQDGSGGTGTDGGQNGNGQDGSGDSGSNGSQDGTGGDSGSNGGQNGGDSGQGTGGGGNGGELPHTGAYETALVTGGASLLLIGGGLVLVSRPGVRRQGR